jgi:ubiquinone/menaquinone biosynthesis C-methylase UbiE
MFSNPEKIIMQVGVSEGMYVADFGVGNGYYAQILAERVGDNGKVFCIDVLNEMLHKLSMDSESKSLFNMEYIWSNLENFRGSTIKKDTIDLVVIANTFFQIIKKDNVAEEAHKILREKGRVLFVEWADSYAGMGPHASHLVPKEEAISIFEKAGFKMENEIDAGEHHYGLIFRKNS